MAAPVENDSGADVVAPNVRPPPNVGGAAFGALNENALVVVAGATQMKKTIFRKLCSSEKSQLHNSYLSSLLLADQMLALDRNQKS